MPGFEMHYIKKVNIYKQKNKAINTKHPNESENSMTSFPVT